MKTKIQAMASRKLAFVGALAGLVVANAEVHGWQWWHAIALGILGAGYAIGQGLHDLGESQGVKVAKLVRDDSKRI